MQSLLLLHVHTCTTAVPCVATSESIPCTRYITRHGFDEIQCEDICVDLLHPVGLADKTFRNLIHMMFQYTNIPVLMVIL